MKIFCLYDSELHIFLNEVVQYVLNRYVDQLNISTLEEIELVDKNTFQYETDGKTINKSKIIVTSRLYELLPCFDIQSLIENNDFKLLCNTIYHEMGHVNDMILMPHLYDCVLNCEKIDDNYVASLFWLEYTAEKRTAGLDNVNDMDICDQFVERKWECSFSNLDSTSDKNFFYLNKVLPYFMARTLDKSVRQSYLAAIDNKLLVKYIEEINIELEQLEQVGYFDDPSILQNLYQIINRYYKKFMRTYL